MVNPEKLAALGANWKPSLGQQIYDGKLQEVRAIIEADQSAATKLDEVSNQTIKREVSR